MSDCLWLHGLQPIRFACPSLSPGVSSNSCPSTVIPSNRLIFYCPFSSCPPSFPASGSFPISQFFTSGGFSFSNLKPTFKQEFSWSWGYKNWLLTHENCHLSLVSQEVSPLCLQRQLSLCSLSLIKSLPSEFPVSRNSFPTHAQTASTCTTSEVPKFYIKRDVRYLTQ